MGLLTTLYHRLGSPQWFYRMTDGWLHWLGLTALIVLAVGMVWGLAFAPPDYQQGNSYRIIFVHVPCAILAQSCYYMMAAAAVVHLVWRMKIADAVIAVAAPLGASFTAIALVTGAIWGKPTWGAWWVWDARTTSMLLLLFLYLGMIALRQAVESRDQAARLVALLVVVGVVNLPIIKFSVDWWLTLHQPSSFTLSSRPAMPASMYLPLLVNVIGFYLYFGWALMRALRVELLAREPNARWARAALGLEEEATHAFR